MNSETVIQLIVSWNEAQTTLFSVNHFSNTPAWKSNWDMFVYMWSITVLLSVVYISWYQLLVTFIS